MKTNKFTVGFLVALVAVIVIAATPDVQRVITTTTANTRALLSSTNVAFNESSGNPNFRLNGLDQSQILLVSSNGVANSRVWAVVGYPSSIQFHAFNDGLGSISKWLEVNRDNGGGLGGVVTSLTFGTNITIKGSLVVTNGLLVSTNSHYGSAILVAGTNLVQGSACNSNSLIYLSRSLSNNVQGHLSYAITNNTNFIIISSTNADVGTVNWMIIQTQ